MWTNEREDPALSKIDAFFCNEAWDISHDEYILILNALSSSLSNRCPFLLACCCGPRKPKTFRFENFWVTMPGFVDVVKKVWEEPCPHYDPYHILHKKLLLTEKHLRTWRKNLSNHKIQLHMDLRVILQFDLAMESRKISPEERDIRARIKRRVIILMALERARKKQCSRVDNLKEGDANTKYFHRMVNYHRRKNFILKLRYNNGWVTSHEEKQAIAQRHFTMTTGLICNNPF
jgi:hypothetical protein